MIFIYCHWVFTLWQWSVNLYKNKKETAIQKRRNSTQNNTQNTEYIKQKTNVENKNRTLNKCYKHKSSNLKLSQQRWANRAQGRRPPPRILHTNHTHTDPRPYLLRRLQSPHFNTFLHTSFSHIYFVKHDDGDLNTRY